MSQQQRGYRNPDPVVRAIEDVTTHRPQPARRKPGDPAPGQRLARTIHAYRVELAVTGVTAGTILTVTSLPPLVAAPAGLLAAGLLLEHRRRVIHTLDAARTRRQWVKAARRVNLTPPPRPGKVTAIRTGDQVQVRVPRGQSVDTIVKRKDELAAVLKVRDLTVLRDSENAGRATVTIVRRDPFLRDKPVAWPPLQTDTLDAVSVWDPVRVGTTENGDPLTQRLVGGHVLVGGITGGGKSVFLRPLLATAALDPGATLWLLDAKLLEFNPWAPCAAGFVGHDGPAAVGLLQHLDEIANQRQQELVAAGGDKIRRVHGLPVHVVFVDELAEFAGMREGQQFMDLLRSLASRGRALGISVVAATQVPHSDIIDTSLRNQFSTRVAFRCADRHHAQTILGNTDVAQLAASIPDTLPGVGYALTETGRFERFRSVFLGRPDDDHPDRPDDVRTVITAASGRRVDAEWQGAPANPVPAAPDFTGSRKRSAQPGKPDVDLMARILATLGPDPVRQQTLARNLGRKQADGAFRRALAELEHQGLVCKTQDGWARAGVPDDG